MNNAAVPVAGDLYLSKGEIKMPQTKDEKKQIIETLGEKHAITQPPFQFQQVR